MVGFSSRGVQGSPRPSDPAKAITRRLPARCCGFNQASEDAQIVLEASRPRDNGSDDGGRLFRRKGVTRVWHHDHAHATPKFPCSSPIVSRGRNGSSAACRLSIGAMPPAHQEPRFVFRPADRWLSMTSLWHPLSQGDASWTRSEEGELGRLNRGRNGVVHPVDLH